MKKRIRAFLGAVLAIGIVFLAPMDFAKAIEEDDDTEVVSLEDQFSAGNLFLFPDSTIASLTDSAPMMASTAMESGISTAKVMGDAINVRKTPSLNAEVVFEMHDSESVQIQETKGEWCKVSYGIIEGYIHTSKLFVLTNKGYNGTVLKDNLPIREAAERHAKVLTNIDTGTGVKVMDFENGYYKVSYGGNVGYATAANIYLDGTFTKEIATRYLKSGMSGKAVTKMQKELTNRRYFSGEATGLYGDLTVKAVKEFQKDAKLKETGVADEETLKLLYGKNNIKKALPKKTTTTKKTTTKSTTTKSSSGGSTKIVKVSPTQVKGKVKLVDWSIVNKTIPRGYSGLQIIDVRTGISFNAKRKGGTVHMDTEPLTAADTAKMKKAYGGSWSWARRPVWVVYKGTYYAASMNGMPHADVTIRNNNFPGHFCVHFLNSQTHAEPGVVQKVDSAHQACVREAFNKAK